MYKLILTYSRFFKKLQKLEEKKQELIFKILTDKSFIIISDSKIAELLLSDYINQNVLKKTFEFIFENETKISSEVVININNLHNTNDEIHYAKRELSKIERILKQECNCRFLVSLSDEEEHLVCPLCGSSILKKDVKSNKEIAYINDCEDNDSKLLSLIEALAIENGADFETVNLLFQKNINIKENSEQKKLKKSRYC